MTTDEVQAALDADLRAVLGTQPGRRFVWRLLTQAGLYVGSWTGAPDATAYNEGRRSVALALLAEARRAAPELYARMESERLALEVAEAFSADDAEPAEG